MKAKSFILALVCLDLVCLAMADDLRREAKSK
jgi:hypothetical protein